MTRKPQTTGFWRGRLPHWEVEDGRYFVTIHLAGAIPDEAAEQIRLLSENFSKRPTAVEAASDFALSRTIFREMENWLDRAEDKLLLARPDLAEMIMEAIQHRVQTHRWMLHQFVIMPNHIHLFLSVITGTLKDSLEDFKRWTGHQAGKLADLPDGRFWQDEWFDHWSRSDEQDENIIRYIIDNPCKAGLVARAEDWPYGGPNRPFPNL